MGFMVKKSLKATSTNLVNERIATLTVTKKTNSNLNQYTAIFLVKRRYCRYFSGWTPSAPVFFQLNAVNTAIYPIKRR